jgi:RimJ/RimL family protein N-acetyltransferase
MTERPLDLSVLRPQRPLATERLRLVQHGPAHLDQAWEALQDAEGLRQTGTHARFTREQVLAFLTRLPDADDRADWAVLRADDGAYLGEVVLNDLDPENRSMGFRIALAGPHVRGQGYGTEATRAVVAFGLDVVGLHRIELEVHAANARARRVYDKAGFVLEGTRRDALRWDGVYEDVHTMAVLASDPRP